MAERWILTRGDAYYPKCLEDLHSPPRVLYGIGDPTLLSTPMLSVIGARRATPYGIAIAEMTARVAVDYGVTVVSGGAMGCDFAAGMSALSGGGKTIVVLGCGADVIYPRSSEPLILAAQEQGVVLSLDPWKTPPRRFAFPRRNAIIAALGSVLVVTEAGIRSGTMTTAEAAIDLGRTLQFRDQFFLPPQQEPIDLFLKEQELFQTRVHLPCLLLSILEPLLGRKKTKLRLKVALFLHFSLHRAGQRSWL